MFCLINNGAWDLKRKKQREVGDNDLEKGET